MKEKKEIKISLTTLLLIIAIIVIIVIVIMGFFLYKSYSEKNVNSTKLNNTISNLENQENILKEEKNEIEETEQQSNDLDQDNSNNQENISDLTNKETNQVTDDNLYIKNFTESVSKELGKENNLCINIANNNQLLIDNNGEAYISNSQEILAKNVVKAWYFEQGQDTGSECILFLKEDGTVTYMLYYLDEASSSLKLDTNEKKLENAKNIVDAVKISGSNNFEENGIGGLGFLLIKNDGTCIPYFHLDKETEIQPTDLDEDNGNNQVIDYNSYIKNFRDSVSKELGNGNNLCVDIANKNQLLIDNNGEAYISNSQEILAKNVVKAWYFEQGQDTGSECILFLKEDGTVTYMLYYLDEASSSLKLDTNEKKLENAKNIVDAVKISGSNNFEENGIGGMGFLLIKNDGSCMPYFHLEN